MADAPDPPAGSTTPAGNGGWRLTSHRRTRAGSPAARGEDLRPYRLGSQMRTIGA